MSPTFNTTGQPAASVLVRTLDDEFSDLAGEVPGFGGLYYDDDGTLTVRLKDTGRADAARSPVSAFLARQAGRSSVRLGQIPGEVGAMRAVAARYDFRELRAWYQEQVVPGLQATDRVTMTDIDERRNRIVIGVRDLSTGGAITDAAPQPRDPGRRIGDRSFRRSRGGSGRGPVSGGARPGDGDRAV